MRNTSYTATHDRFIRKADKTDVDLRGSGWMFLDRKYLCLVVQPASWEEKLDWKDTQTDRQREKSRQVYYRRCNSASVHQRSVQSVSSAEEKLVQLQHTDENKPLTFTLNIFFCLFRRKKFVVSCCSNSSLKLHDVFIEWNIQTQDSMFVMAQPFHQMEIICICCVILDSFHQNVQCLWTLLVAEQS